MLLPTKINPFVCWKCLNRHPYTTASSLSLRNVGRRPSNSRCSLQLPHLKNFTLSRYRQTAIDPKTSNSGAKPTIRERLREWEKENVRQLQPEQAYSYTLDPLLEETFNPAAIPFLSHLRLQNRAEEVSEDDLPIQDVEDGLEGVKRDYLIPGDLVDLKFGSNNNEMAIYVQRLDLQSQYYTMSGRWLHQRGTNVNIYFPKFVDVSEIDEIRPFLPREDVPLDQEDTLHCFTKALPRNIGAPLLQKMKNFWNQANAVYEAAASRIDESHSIVAHPTTFRYATISELAEEILSGIVPRNKDGNFPNPALYALHRRIHNDTAGFTLANLRKARGEAQYEITSLQLTREMAKVVGYVRKFNIFNLRKGESKKPVEILNFAQKASKLIQRSRKVREFTNFGNVGPYFGKPDEELKPADREIFDGTDLEIVRFLEVWTGLSSLSSIVGFSYDSAGATILRAIGQYDDPAIHLSRQTAWTCLKEIGAITPCQTISEYGTRAINTSCRLLLGPKPISTPSDCSVDRMKELRTDCDYSTAYCVDDVNAQELDDAISLEATDSPDNYWVHVHVADPTSFLDPNGPESKFAQEHGDTIFLPNRKIPMLDHDMVMKYMSLASGSPCLTFSVKLDFNGQVLDSKISPGNIRNLLCITPRVFAEVAEVNSLPAAPLTYIVGPKMNKSTSTRKMTEKHQLSAKEKEVLKILNQLGEARAVLLQRKGAAFMPNEQTSTDVYFKEGGVSKVTDNFILPNCDPTIEIKVPGSHQDFVVGHLADRKTYGLALTTFMQMAGQVAAKWCSERGIPIPYRVAIPQLSDEDPAKFYRLNILPFIEQKKSAPEETVSKYLALIGPAHLSSDPAPHPALALDSYTKVTSPLRRYLDMVVHWQINAALREEHKSRQSLVGNTQQGFLPFSKTQLDAMMPHMTRLERWVKYYQNGSIQEWKCQFLLRAWKYGQAPLPSPLVFVAKRMILGSRNCVYGELTCFAIKALMEVPSFMPFGEIKVGDIFQVEISELSVSSQKVMLEPIRKLNKDDIPILDQKSSP